MISANCGRAEYCLNWNVYDISANCEFLMKCMQKNEHHRKNQLLFLAQCRYTEIAQRMFICSDIQ